MALNLMDAAKGIFTNELIGKASSFLGENENGVTKAITGILPSLLGGIVDKATTSNEGAVTILNLAKESADEGFLDNISNLLGGGESLLNKGAGLLSGLLGNSNSNLLSNLIAQFSGVKSSSATSLLSMAAPAVLGMLGNQAKQNNLDADGLSSFLGSQKDNILSSLPSELNLGSIFSGWGSKATEAVSTAAATTHSVVSHASHHAEEAVEEAGGFMKYLVPILLLALIAAACWYFFKDGCRSNDGAGHGTVTTPGGNTTNSADAGTTVSIPAIAGKLDSLTGDFIYDLGETVELSLPDGGKLSVGKNSTEYKLIQFLNDKSAALDTVKGNWFEFTNVRFKTGGSEITSTSEAQLKNLVAIAKAFPNAKFKIGGYTDNSGDAAGNKILSQKRADAVAAKINSLGIAAGAITGAEGYGQEWPIASNDTPEGKAQNRRVAVNVKAK
ncbi:MAG TPA: OmpA family protein [Ferruginibacter sp.]|nr:OmpA family protein [Ferruginibacter sp.]HRE64864.1 OmpA family protein [Ferruginibacter sp.]